ncbi:hypothetical protein [Actinospica sp.]|uniref:hypothetical protein n=1 Tax=Actinospica sp. TaxID=1872142 RepID=UPI002D7FCEE2|nr:hypothetical protein [Actinospica sp.]
MIPSRVARRRARWALGIVLGAWVGFDAVIGLLVRAHAINERCTGYCMGAGGMGWFLVFPVWFGMSSRARLVDSGGRSFVVGRTLTGLRAVDLDELVSVRRFQALGRTGQFWDELRLRDRWGVRLSADRVDGIDRAVKNAVEARAVRVSSAVKDRLGMRRRTRPMAGGRALLGVFVLVGSLGGFVIVSLYLTCLIAGTPLNG